MNRTWFDGVVSFHKMLVIVGVMVLQAAISTTPSASAGIVLPDAPDVCGIAEDLPSYLLKNVDFHFWDDLCYSGDGVDVPCLTAECPVPCDVMDWLAECVEPCVPMWHEVDCGMTCDPFNNIDGCYPCVPGVDGNCGLGVPQLCGGPVDCGDPCGDLCRIDDPCEKVNCEPNLDPCGTVDCQPDLCDVVCPLGELIGDCEDCEVPMPPVCEGECDVGPPAGCDEDCEEQCPPSCDPLGECPSVCDPPGACDEDCNPCPPDCAGETPPPPDCVVGCETCEDDCGGDPAPCESGCDGPKPPCIPDDGVMMPDCNPWYGEQIEAWHQFVLDAAEHPLVQRAQEEIEEATRGVGVPLITDPCQLMVCTLEATYLPCYSDLCSEYWFNGQTIVAQLGTPVLVGDGPTQVLLSGVPLPGGHLTVFPTMLTGEGQGPFDMGVRLAVEDAPPIGIGITTDAPTMASVEVGAVPVAGVAEVPDVFGLKFYGGLGASWAGASVTGAGVDVEITQDTGGLGIAWMAHGKRYINTLVDDPVTHEGAGLGTRMELSFVGTSNAASRVSVGESVVSIGHTPNMMDPLVIQYADEGGFASVEVTSDQPAGAVTYTPGEGDLSVHAASLPTKIAAGLHLGSEDLGFRPSIPGGEVLLSGRGLGSPSSGRLNVRADNPASLLQLSVSGLGQGEVSLAATDVLASFTASWDLDPSGGQSIESDLPAIVFTAEPLGQTPEGAFASSLEVTAPLSGADSVGVSLRNFRSVSVNTLPAANEAGSHGITIETPGPGGLDIAGAVAGQAFDFSVGLTGPGTLQAAVLADTEYRCQDYNVDFNTVRTWSCSAEEAQENPSTGVTQLYVDLLSTGVPFHIAAHGGGGSEAVDISGHDLERLTFYADGGALLHWSAASQSMDWRMAMGVHSIEATRTQGNTDVVRVRDGWLGGCDDRTYMLTMPDTVDVCLGALTLSNDPTSLRG